ncbi:tripeptidyl-peptidase 2 [Trichonephila clavipes]|nr:tripeptidyl-peptidase 2 [Trichonephila clavipes]
MKLAYLYFSAEPGEKSNEWYPIDVFLRENEKLVVISIECQQFKTALSIDMIKSDFLDQIVHLCEPLFPSVCFLDVLDIDPVFFERYKSTSPLNIQNSYLQAYNAVKSKTKKNALINSFPADVYPIKYIIPEFPKKGNSKSVAEKEKTLEEEFCEEVRQMKITWVAKLTGKASKELFEEILAKETENLCPILIARLQSLDKEYEKISQNEDKKPFLLEMIKLADKVLATSNPNEILAALGCKTDKKEQSNHKK